MQAPHTARGEEAENALRQIPLPPDEFGRREPRLYAAPPEAASAEAFPEPAAELPEEPRGLWQDRLRDGLRRFGPAAARLAGAALVLLIAACVVHEAAGGRLFLLKRLEMSGDVQKVPLARLKEAVEPAAAGFFVFLVETGFHHVDQDGLDLLTS